MTCGMAMNTAGGTHHAYRDRGEGFCVFNDVAVAINVARREFADALREHHVAHVRADPLDGPRVRGAPIRKPMRVGQALGASEVHEEELQARDAVGIRPVVCDLHVH